MVEYERERDQCPMHFDDGENPWVETEQFIKIFDWDFYKANSCSTFVPFSIINFVILVILNLEF